MSNPRLASHRQIGLGGQKKEDDKNEQPKNIFGKKKFTQPKSSTEPQSALELFKEQSSGIMKWLEENKEFIKVNAVCKAVGYTSANLAAVKANGGNIPIKYIDGILTIIRKFGYDK